MVLLVGLVFWVKDGYRGIVQCDLKQIRQVGLIPPAAFASTCHSYFYLPFLVTVAIHR
jgi:hypothetical protein